MWVGLGIKLSWWQTSIVSHLAECFDACERWLVWTPIGRFKIKFCIPMYCYLYLLVCIGMIGYVLWICIILVWTDIEWYVLICRCQYWYVLGMWKASIMVGLEVCTWHVWIVNVNTSIYYIPNCQCNTMCLGSVVRGDGIPAACRDCLWMEFPSRARFESWFKSPRKSLEVWNILADTCLMW